MNKPHLLQKLVGASVAGTMSITGFFIATFDADAAQIVQVKVNNGARVVIEENIEFNQDNEIINVERNATRILDLPILEGGLFDVEFVSGSFIDIFGDPNSFNFTIPRFFGNENGARDAVIDINNALNETADKLQEVPLGIVRFPLVNNSETYFVPFQVNTDLTNLIDVAIAETGGFGGSDDPGNWTPSQIEGGIPSGGSFVTSFDQNTELVYARFIPVPENSFNLGLFVFSTLGLASTLKRKIKPFKSTPK